MAKTFWLEVISPEAIIWSGEAQMVITRTTEGEIGILAGHEPTMAALATASTVITPEAGEKVILAIHGGFLQIAAGRVTLLTDRAEVTRGDTDEARRMAEEMAEEGA